MMIDNPIVNEVNRIRQQILAEYGGNLRAWMLDAQRRTEEAARAGHPMFTPRPRKPQPQVAPAKKLG